MINPNADRNEVQRRIDNIRKGFDTSATEEVALLLEFLLEEHEVMYTRTYRTSEKSFRIYQSTKWQQLEDIVNNAKDVAILSAQLRDTLVGFVLEKVMKIAVTEVVINDKIYLETLHKNRARIYPILEKDKWSSYQKGRPANEALSYQGKPVESFQSVCLYAQEVAASILTGNAALLFLNKKDDQHELLSNPDIKRLPTSAHGRNDLTKFHHAIYLGSNRPDRDEEYSLKLFAVDHGLTGDEIMNVVLRERCYETAYQCIARTSIRDPHVDPEKEHIFIVPDEACAQYIYDWFAKWCAKIDPSHLHTLQPSSASKDKEERILELIIQIRTDYIAKKGKLKELLVKHGLKEKTYKRYVERFRHELETDGLIKPKRKAA